MTIVSAITCRNCGDTVFSRAIHDFRTCSCFKNEFNNKGVAIDGGFDYIRLCGDIDAKLISIDIDVTKEELYDDWNKRIDKFGIIKKETVNA